MEFKTIAGHTFIPRLIGSGKIIDVGCRGFEFANYFTHNKVYAIDPDPRVFADYIPDTNIRCIIAAISDKKGDSAIYINGEGTCLKELDPDQTHKFEPCQTLTMDDIYDVTGTDIEILKLDCEGAEYTILGEGFKPIPKQITVEFHYHCIPDTHNKHFPAIKERLLKDYELVNEIYESRHGCGLNWWDSLFVKKGLL